MTPALQRPLLRVQALACRRGGRTLFSDLDFDLVAGGLITLSGPNGSGKTTLLRILAGLAEADAGSVHADEPGEPAELTHYYGHRDGLRDALTARENLVFLTELLGGDRNGIAEALGRLGVHRLADLPVRVLSAGQRRRVALARLLTAPRSIWLLDEPLTALDANGQALVSGLIRGHLAGNGAVIVATHQPLAMTGRTIQLGGEG